MICLASGAGEGDADALLRAQHYELGVEPTPGRGEHQRQDHQSVELLVREQQVRGRRSQLAVRRTQGPSAGHGDRRQNGLLRRPGRLLPVELRPERREDHCEALSHTADVLLRIPRTQSNKGVGLSL